MVENTKTLWSHEHELFLKYSCFASKNYWRFEYLMTAREISKSDFFASFCK